MKTFLFLLLNVLTAFASSNLFNGKIQLSVPEAVSKCKFLLSDYTNDELEKLFSFVGLDHYNDALKTEKSSINTSFPENISDRYIEKMRLAYFLATMKMGPLPEPSHDVDLAFYVSLLFDGNKELAAKRRAVTLSVYPNRPLLFLFESPISGIASTMLPFEFLWISGLFHDQDSVKKLGSMLKSPKHAQKLSDVIANPPRKLWFFAALELLKISKETFNDISKNWDQKSIQALEYSLLKSPFRHALFDADKEELIGKMILKCGTISVKVIMNLLQNYHSMRSAEVELQIFCNLFHSCDPKKSFALFSKLNKLNDDLQLSWGVASMKSKMRENKYLLGNLSAGYLGKRIGFLHQNTDPLLIAYNDYLNDWTIHDFDQVKPRSIFGFFMPARAFGLFFDHLGNQKFNLYIISEAHKNLQSYITQLQLQTLNYPPQPQSFYSSASKWMSFVLIVRSATEGQNYDSQFKGSRAKRFLELITISDPILFWKKWIKIFLKAILRPNFLNFFAVRVEELESILDRDFNQKSIRIVKQGFRMFKFSDPPVLLSVHSKSLLDIKFNFAQ